MLLKNDLTSINENDQNSSNLQNKSLEDPLKISIKNNEINKPLNQEIDNEFIEVFDFFIYLKFEKKRFLIKLKKSF